MGRVHHAQVASKVNSDILSGAPDTAGFSAADYLGNMFTGKVDYARQRELQDIVNTFNANEAQKARDFEERMSNTAYQRAVRDLKAAGLNPALLYSSAGQATTPSGVSASGAGATAPHAGQGILQLISVVVSALGGFMLESQRAAHTAELARQQAADRAALVRNGVETVYTDKHGVVRGGMSTRYY